jgi:competence protein ComEC
LTLGALRTEYARETLHPLDVLIESKVTLMGTICDEPQTKTTSQSICFLPDTAPDKILISTNPYPAFTYGDRLEIRGKLTVPENFTAYEGGPEFNYVSYLGKDGIRYTMFRPAIKLIEKSRLSLQKILFDIKHAFTRKAEQLLPEPESSLLGGILLGDKQGLSKETTLEFKNAGLIHILVLSGYNVTIVAESLMKMFSFLPRAFGHSLGFISIILFALMTGASSTTVRASIMALIAIGGRVGARRYDVTRALISAGLCMVVVNPDILVFDISFQLSFMSTLALIYVSPLVSDRLGFITKRGNLRDMIATTLATQILVAPYIIYSMGQISLISLVSNIFVGPIIPYAMFVGFGALVLGFVHPFIGLPLAWITTLMLSYILHATSFFGNLPFASIQIHTGVVTLVCMYVIYIIFLRREWRRKNSVPPSAS